jgi:hypothetical protein
MLALAAVALAAVVTNQDLRIQIEAAKSPIQVGEMTKVRARWTVVRPVEIVVGGEDVLIDKGAGFQSHVEATEAKGTVVRSPTAFAAGDEITTDYRLGLEHRDIGNSTTSGMAGLSETVALLFNTPGIYRVKVVYEDAVSNVLEIKVVNPDTEADAAAFGVVRREPALLSWYAGADEELFAHARAVLQERGVTTHFGPVALEVYGGTEESFAELRSLDFSNSALEDDYLLALAEAGGRFVGPEYEMSVLLQVVERFPDTAAEARARYRLSKLDREPPTLEASAQPSELWPPNRKLVPVTVNVSVSDNIDRGPRVQLQEITCADEPGGPCSSDDIAGAQVGTDDRAFQLRAIRGGGSIRRTYRATYAAFDQAGNRTTKQVTIVVPHDQR